MKKAINKETIIWSIFIGHALIIFSLFFFNQYKGFDIEEFNEFFWYLYPVLLFWGYRAYKTVVYKDNLILSFKVFRATLFLMFVMQVCIAIKALAPWVINFSELKIAFLFIELINLIYLFFKIIEADALEEHKLTENGL